MKKKLFVTECLAGLLLIMGQTAQAAIPVNNALHLTGANNLHLNKNISKNHLHLKPDLTVTNIKAIERSQGGCYLQVTLKNSGIIDLPGSVYSGPRVGIQMYAGHNPWGGMVLHAFDPAKKLQKHGHSLTRDWFKSNNLILQSGKAYAMKVVVDSNHQLAEANENNNVLVKKITCGSQARKPDLTVTGVTIKKSSYNPAKGRIFITVKNIGGPIPRSQFDKSSVSLLKGNTTWGTYALKAVDRSGVLKRAGATLTFPWNAILVNAGTYNIGAFIDSNNAIAESNEHNNRYSPRAVIFGHRASLPDLGLYGFIKIGKRKKQVDYNRTITLTPADAHLISNGRPAFDVYYGYREYNGVPAGGFENKIYFNSTMVSRQSNLALRAKEIKQVHTQAYMGPAAGRLCIKIDATNRIHESGDSNNNGCINVRFSGFGNGAASHTKVPIGKINNVPRHKPNFLLPGDKVKKEVVR